MLHFISWRLFISFSLVAATLYYLVIGRLFYWKEIKAWTQQVRKKIEVSALLLGLCGALHAQTADGNNGISQANTLIRSYFTTGTQLMYAVGALVGLIGAVRVFQLWNGGHREDVNRAAAAWFGSCIFLVIVATVIQAFFGL